MAFNTNDVEDDSNFTSDQDPSLRKMEKKAAASVMQDVGLHTYWANTMGRPALKYTGVYTMYKKELKQNLEALLDSKMTYNQIEEYLGTVGYCANDVRCVFKKITGVDPVKLEFMRQEDLKSTPGNIPGFNCGWGLSKKGGVESYFITQDGRGLYVVFAQKNDQEREEVKTFLRHDEALEALEKLVKSVHRYDMPAKEAAEEAPELDEKEPTSKFYIAVANRCYDLEKKGALAVEYVYKIARDGVTCGNLTQAEGEYLIKKYATEMPTPTRLESPVSPIDSASLSEDLAEKTVEKFQPSNPDVLDTSNPHVDVSLQTTFANRNVAREFLKFVKEELEGAGWAEQGEDPKVISWWVEIPGGDDLDKVTKLNEVFKYLNDFMGSPAGKSAANIADEEGATESQAPQRTKVLQSGQVIGSFVRTAAPIPAGETVPVAPAHVQETDAPSTDPTSKMIKNVQDNTSVNKEIKKRTPQDFFKATLPDRIEEIATEHIEDVLSYIANRESDIDGFGIALHSLQYQKHDAGKTQVGEINPQTGEPSGPPKATISAILEIENKTMSDDKNKKFVLAVFFVNANGQISTSDSVKGEDDIIYGFTQEGLEQYFQKNTKEPKI